MTGEAPVLSYVNSCGSRKGKGRSSVSGAWVTTVLLGVACGAPEDERPPPPSSGGGTELDGYDPSTGDDRDQVAAGTCENGDTQGCRVYLPEHNGVQPCFVGTQTCLDSAWSSCGDAVLVDANADDTELPTDDETL
jgi:hypothetical protein